MKQTDVFSGSALALDAEKETERIVSMLRETAVGFKKKGAVVGLSGGIDSSTVAALCVRAFGSGRVTGLLMPERDSSPDTLMLSRALADHFGMEAVHEDITEILDAFGCYRRRNDSVRTVLPEFRDDWKIKIVLPGLLEEESLRLFSVVALAPDGKEYRARLSSDAYLGILAASNFKQRVRKTLEYYYADRQNFLVAGTPNRLEYDQGFFVKLGDGAADVKPIAHLYKTQVYSLAEYLGVPAEIRKRPPTTDTYSMAQSQEEFYFSVSHYVMDLCLYAVNNGIPIDETARAVELTEEQVGRIFNDIEQKRKSTRYLHNQPVLLEQVIPYMNANRA